MFTTNNYYYFDGCGDNKLLPKILETINYLKTKIEIMGQKGDEIKADLVALKGSLDNLGADLDRIATQIEGGLTAEEAVSVSAEVKNMATIAKTLADRNPEDVPP